jgi:hypothetical protein
MSDFKSAGAIDLGRWVRRPETLPDFGAKFDRDRVDPFAAERLRRRKFNREASVFIQCGWRLIADGGPEQTEPGAAEGQDFSHFDKLVGQTVIAASIDAITLELSMQFNDRSTLSLGPLVYPYRMRGGYHVQRRGRYWGVADNCQITETFHPWP